MTFAPPPTQPDCPRCGYDLSGSVAAWADACPLTSTCSECGLEIRWDEVFNPTKRLPHWSFEHARRRFALAFARTWLRALRPWAFWRELTMYHPIAGRRLAIFGVVLGTVIAAMWLPLLAPDPVHVWVVGRRYHGVQRYVPQWLTYSAWAWAGVMSIFALWTLLWAGCFFVLLPQALRRTRVLPIHVLRGAIYSFIGPATYALARLALILARAFSDLLSELNSYSPRLRWRPDALDEAIDWLERFLTSPVTIVLIAVWLSVWWFWTTRRYLRLPQAAWVTAAFGVISGLATALVELIRAFE